MATKKSPPWKRKRPKGPAKHLSSAAKTKAKAREEGRAAVSQPGGQYGDREKEANAEAQMRSGREALET
jgi:hypothetical protein